MTLAIGLVLAHDVSAVQGDAIPNRPVGAPLSVSPGSAVPQNDPRNSVFVGIGPGKPFSTDPHYCYCDGGPRLAEPDRSVTYPAGTSGYAFPWSGKSWDGPSDTGNPEGAFFPVGHYAANVTFLVDETKRITLALPFDVT
jgi:hypothetical protein